MGIVLSKVWCAHCSLAVFMSAKSKHIEHFTECFITFIHHRIEAANRCRTMINSNTYAHPDMLYYGYCYQQTMHLINAKLFPLFYNSRIKLNATRAIVSCGLCNQNTRFKSVFVLDALECSISSLNS